MNPSVRPAAVAGTFYPDSAAALEDCISHLLANAPRLSMHAPKAVIVPHAGYIYSGPVAASLYAQVIKIRQSIRRVVLLGPTHRVGIRGLALPACTAFSTPLGTVKLDLLACASIEHLPQVSLNAAAHAQEHSLEVQLPFLQSTLDDFLLVPLAVGDATPEAVAEVLELLWGGPETLIVVSSDLSHYQPYASACEIDAETARGILDLEPTVNHQAACGAASVNGLLLAARHHGLQSRLVDLRNSGDTAGDKTRVVGYGAFAFTEGVSHVN